MLHVWKIYYNSIKFYMNSTYFLSDNFKKNVLNNFTSVKKLEIFMIIYTCQSWLITRTSNKNALSWNV